MFELSSAAERESLVAAYITTLHTEPTGSVYRPHPATWWRDLDGASRNEIRLVAERRNITLLESR